MIFKRAVAKLRAQDWTAITIELAIVVIGVFVGIQAANWNTARLEQRQTQLMLSRLKPELHKQLEIYAGAKAYYGVTRRYADTALAGWASDPNVEDCDFVTAAYEASQLYATATNNETWATIFGADRLASIDDPIIRDNLSFLMYADTTSIVTAAADTPYRQNVRRVIPVAIQDAIRAKCGDQRPPNNPQLFYLPSSCDAPLDRDSAAKAAVELRAHPELVGDLRWHTAALASYVNNLTLFEIKTRTLLERIDQLD